MLEAEHKMKLFFAVRPWENEPDHAEWVHDNGYKCRIMRNEITGTLCGYVGVPKGHKFFKMEYNNIALDFLNEVHGELTFSGPKEVDFMARWLHSYGDLTNVS